MPSKNETSMSAGPARAQFAATFQGLADAVPDALMGVDRSGLIRFVNHHTEALFGYGRGDLVGLPIETLVPESVRQVHEVHGQEDAAAAFPRLQGQDLSLLGRRRDGTEFPVDIALSQMDSGNDPLVIAAVRDATDRQKSEDERRRSDRLAAVVEFSGEAIISSTLDGIITSFNPAADTMFGYSRGEVLGRHITMLSPESRAAESYALIEEIQTGRSSENLETLRVHKDGSEFPVSLTLSPICGERGAAVGICAIVRDMTELKAGFEAARSMIESSLDSLVAISPEGKITDANQATVKVTGIPREELIGTSFSECFTEPDQANQIYQLVFAQGTAIDYPLTMRHRNGTLTDVRYNASVYRNAAGNILGVFAAARDVTKEVQGQREIAAQQSKELDRLAELERFQRLTIGRELRMIELKKQIEYLKKFGPTDEGGPG